MCYDDYIANLLRVAFNIIGAFVIVVVNFILKIVLKALGTYKRFMSMTNEMVS